MNQNPLVVITTRLPPQICGIGTYSWLLHKHWPGETEHVWFLVVDGAGESAAHFGHDRIAEFHAEADNLSRELDRIGPADLLLHYAGRGYHRFGCPLWLPPVLADWRKKFPSGRLLILFHEVPGELPITSRHYWIDICNRRVIRKLARLADALVTNTADHVSKLEKISSRQDVHLVPVGSNIEPPADLSPVRAQTEFAILGLPFGRWQTLQMFAENIRSWQQSGRSTKLHLIGPADEKFGRRSDLLIKAWPDPGAAVHHGLLPAAEVSKLLGQVQFGLTNATMENWSKSTAFMAYASHGCAIVSKIASDSIPLGFTVAPDEVGTISAVDLAERTRALKEWHRQNAGWDVIARKIARLLPAQIQPEPVL